MKSNSNNGLMFNPLRIITMFFGPVNDKILKVSKDFSLTLKNQELSEDTKKLILKILGQKFLSDNFG